MNYWIKGASSFSGDVDHLFWIVTGFIGFWFVVAQAITFYFVIRYRRKEGEKAAYITGKSWKQLAWVFWPTVLVVICDGFIDVATAGVWHTMKETLPPAEQTVLVTAQQWAYTFRHAGPDGLLGTPDDIVTVDDLHLEVGKTCHFKLESTDVLHSFSIPTMRVKQDVIPGRTITGWFKPTATGVYDIQCAQICGIGHGYMYAHLTVETADEHKKWIKDNAVPATMQAPPAAAPAAPVAAPAAK